MYCNAFDVDTPGQNNIQTRCPQWVVVEMLPTHPCGQIMEKNLYTALLKLIKTSIVCGEFARTR
jgi:hypothetical protein